MNIVFKTLKIVLALILFVSMLAMPDGYYIFVRYSGMIIFVILSIEAIKKRKIWYAIADIFLAIIHEPFYIIPMHKLVWSAIFVAALVYLLYMLVAKKPQ